jgi:hypothetical protein
MNLFDAFNGVDGKEMQIEDLASTINADPVFVSMYDREQLVIHVVLI